MKKIVIAPDSFKESLTALEVALAIEEGFKAIYPDAEYLKIPMADGGEGTVESMVDSMQGKRRKCNVTGPLGNRLMATYALSQDHKMAVIEMAASSGLMHVPIDQRNPMITTSYGTGELILDALEMGARHFIIGIGGSATNDGGIGMLQALGGRFLDSKGREIAWGGGSLIDIASIDLKNLDPRLQQSVIDVACDVDNPLIGPNGASAIFGPQKGADQTMIDALDKGLFHFSTLIKENLGISVANLSGAGAAGGMGAALHAFLQGRLRPGCEIIAEAVHLKEAMIGADLVITGEGRLDGQTIMGKTPIGVADVAGEVGIPLIALAGMVAEDAEIVIDKGIAAIFPIIQAPSTLEEALASAHQNIVLTSRNVARLLKVSNRIVSSDKLYRDVL